MDLCVFLEHMNTNICFARSMRSFKLPWEKAQCTLEQAQYTAPTFK